MEYVDFIGRAAKGEHRTLYYLTTQDGVRQPASAELIIAEIDEDYIIGRCIYSSEFPEAPGKDYMLTMRYVTAVV